jgi:hypothetical protein
MFIPDFKKIGVAVSMLKYTDGHDQHIMKRTHNKYFEDISVTSQSSNINGPCSFHIMAFTSSCMIFIHSSANLCNNTENDKDKRIHYLLY